MSLREVALDIKEGADMVMIKPGLPYLDVIQKVKEKFKIPVLAYQVSGEYGLIKNGIYNKQINEEAIIESNVFKRAGASAIVSYFRYCKNQILAEIILKSYSRLRK